MMVLAQVCGLFCGDWSSNVIRIPLDGRPDLDLHSAVCHEIHPFDGCKCPLRDKPRRENSIDVQGADMLY